MKSRSQEAMMFKGSFLAVSAAMLGAMALASGTSAQAGERHRVAVIHHHHHFHAAPWYRQPPWLGTGVGHYYSYHPHHIPGYPHRLSGYPIPIHRMADSDPVVRAFRGEPSAHSAWCFSRYRSYDPRSDTYRPHAGPRRLCISPYR